MREKVWLWPLLLLFGACSGVQTPLDPLGDQAARIAVLSWVLFIGGTAIFALVMGLLVFALIAPARVRNAIGNRRFVIGGGIVFPTVTLIALLVYSLGVSRALVVPQSDDPLRIEIIARQYWWEVRYPDAGEGAVTANELHLPVGREVELILTSGDVIHSVWIPNLHGKMDMIPGKANRQRLRADRPGVMRGQCTEFCGTQHTLMAFWAVAQEPADFEAWLARQRDPVPEPANAEQARGREVFGEAGCGACHAVRGTEWQGRLGPDLSRIGSRLTIGAGALENNRGTLAGWVAGSQDIKPGNAMPSFGRSLSGDDLRAVAAWMEALR
ncbi:cytochrome c oxidase subunit II [Falsiroseomonas sp. HC035]|uniref:cytochrome c oxidase subunit II n=1 Tax=Falsiroseomonas sp. HC035 TaxID=3390999 RepID=UPI003D323193